MSDHKTSRNLKWAIILTGSILGLEVAGGIISGSLALLADAGHVFMDVFALSLSLAALRIADIPADTRRTFGWHRAEVFAALINGLAILLIAGFILHEAYERILHPTMVNVPEMMTVAAVGLAVNMLVAWKLHDHDSHDLNVKSAYLHVIGDMLGSVAVIIGGAVMIFADFKIIDPLLSIGIVGLILFGAVRILRESVHLLLEGVPPYIRLEELEKDINAVPGISQVHDLHVWSVCSHITNLSCHVEIKETAAERRAEILSTLKEMFLHKFRISHTTIEVDTKACALPLVSQDLHHRGHYHHHHH